MIFQTNPNHFFQKDEKKKEKKEKESKENEM